MKKSEKFDSAKETVTATDKVRPISVKVNPGEKVHIDLELYLETEVTLSIHKVDHNNLVARVLHRKFNNSTHESIKKIKEIVIRLLKTPILSRLKANWPLALLIAASFLYLITRFISLDSYPIYFFCDEATQTVLAQDLVRDQFKSYTGEFLPTFLENGGQYEMGPSVYLQILPLLLFGKSIWVTRGTSAFLTLIAAISVGLIFKKVLKSNLGFVSILLLSITPAWFLHSRTAFEPALSASFYAVFLYTYLKYRTSSPRFLYIAVVFGALSFYTYSPAQVVMAVSAVALLLVDLPIHLKNWKLVAFSFGLFLLCSVPYIRFMIIHQDENLHLLKIINSYWVLNIPIIEKLSLYFKEYFKSLNPSYWFFPNPPDLIRHVMKGYGHVMLWTLPFFTLGLGKSIFNLKNPVYRVFLVALFAAPTGAAVANLGITRAIFMIIPITLLTTLGIDQMWKWLSKIKLHQAIFSGVVFAILSVLNIFILVDALKNGPTWFDNYGLDGQQYGAKQLLGEIHNILAEQPDTKIFLSPSWTNGTDTLTRFFFDDPVPFTMGGVDSVLFSKMDFDEDQVFIFLPDEIEKIQESGKFKKIDIFKTLDYPNGKPGFYFMNLQYVDNIDQILEQEKEIRKQLIEKTIITSDGAEMVIRFSMLDMGEVDSLFDGNRDTMIRTLEANPMKLEINFIEPREITEVVITIGGAVTRINLEVIPEDEGESFQKTLEVGESNQLRDIVIKLDHSLMAGKIILSIMNVHSGEPSHVHVWEIAFK